MSGPGVGLVDRTDAHVDQAMDMGRYVYYRLHDRRGLVVGFMRVDDRGRRHYVDLQDEAWSRIPIRHETTVKLGGPLPGFAYLRAPR